MSSTGMTQRHANGNYVAFGRITMKNKEGGSYMDYKQHTIKLALNPKFKSTIETDLVAWSHDKNSYKFYFELSNTCGEPVILDGVVGRIKLDFLREGKTIVESLDIESEHLGLASFTIPDGVLGYEGKVEAHVYLDYESQTHDLGNFSFLMKKSSIDNKLPGLEFYVSEWDEAMEQWNEVQKEVKQITENMQSDIEDIKKQIADNDVVKKKDFEESVESVIKEIDDIKENDKVIADTSYYWNPPKMEDTRRGNGKVPSGYNPNEHLDALMQPLADNFPEYVTRKDLGETQDGGYTIRRYDFVPEKYEKTIILSACLHGNEYTGFYALYQFLETLTTKWDEYPQLKYLRNNVRIITVPIINMWGFANQKRQNSRGVDMNRNFPLYWEGFSSDQPGNTYYKGEAPLSEAETKIMDNLLKEFNDAVSYMDFHTTNVVKGEYVYYYPRHLKNSTRKIAELVRFLKKPDEKEVWSSSKLPELTTHACHVYNMNAGNPEFVNTEISSNVRSSEEMTRAARWFGNVVLESSKMHKPNVELLYEKQIKFINYNQTSSFDNSFTHQIFNNLDYTYITMRPKATGVLTFTGSVTFEANSFAVGKRVRFYPHLYQEGSKEFNYNDTKDNPRSDQSLKINAEGEYTMYLNNAIFVDIFTDDNQRVGDSAFRMRAKTGGGRITIKNISGMLEFTPLDDGDRLEIFDSTKKEANGLNAMERTFPSSITGDNTEE